MVPPKPESRVDVEYRFAGHELETRKFRKAGISLLVPKGAFDFESWGQGWLDRLADPTIHSRGVNFTLIRFSPRSWFVEYSDLSSASFGVYTPDDLRAAGRSLESLEKLPPAPSPDQAASAISFGPITVTQSLVASSGGIRGLDAKSFHITGRSRDGRIVYGTISRAEYTSNEEAIARDLNTVTNILTSVRFLDP